MLRIAYCVSFSITQYAIRNTPETMNPQLFQDGAAGRPYRVGRGETAYWAFIPNPLPPALDFDIRLIQTLSDADRALGELAGLAGMLPNPDLLVHPFIRREAVLSSRIEGTRADITNLYAYEAGQLHLPGFAPPVPEEDVREVLNYVHAMEYGLERRETLPVSLRFVRELHERLFAGIRGQATPGEFRRTQNWIGRPGCTLNEATYVPPPVPQMQEALAAWESYIHADDDLPPLVRLALIHYQFEAIHPFLDGNGRVGRLLNSILLVDWGLLPYPLLYLSAYFESNRPAYYDALFHVSTRGDWANWLNFYLQGVITQGEDGISRARQLLDLQLHWRATLSQDARTSILMGRLADYLFEWPILTIPRVQQFLDVSYPTAKSYVEKLARAGIVKAGARSAQGKIFYAPAILRIMAGLKTG